MWKERKPWEKVDEDEEKLNQTPILHHNSKNQKPDSAELKIIQTIKQNW